MPGIQDVLGGDQLRRLHTDAILLNVRHSNREIDVAWLDQRTHQTVSQSIDRYTVDNRNVFLINRGSLVNLALGAHVAVDEFFDPFAAIILPGLAWILDGGATEATPGLQPYPHQLEREIADLTRSRRT